MLNPLIHKHPGDTLHYVYCVLTYLESLPDEDGAGVAMSENQVFGYFAIMQCVKNALMFEYERTKVIPDEDEELPHPAKIIRGIENIQHPALKNRVLLEFEKAIDVCNKPAKLA